MAIKAVQTEQKLRGGYYTPQPIADFLTSWAVSSDSDSVLEPSCGDGNILVSAAQRLQQLSRQTEIGANQLLGVEFEADEAKKAQMRLKGLGLSAEEASHAVRNDDFFAVCDQLLSDNRHFDAVVGNPPFIRYQDFVEDHRQRAFTLMRQAGLNPNRLTNSWVPFLVAASQVLKEDGRLAMVIPAELFQVNYAAEVRQYLSDFFHRMTIVTFRELVFEGIQQEVVLLLCERAATGTEGIRVVELDSASDLNTYSEADFAHEEVRPIDHSRDKWTQYYLSADEIRLLRRLRECKKLTKASEVLDVDVGVVTGQNKFFVLTAADVDYYQLHDVVVPIVGRSAHLKGIRYSEEDRAENDAAQLPTFLFLPPNVPKSELSEAARAYIEIGEKAKVHYGYKCSIRRNWYVVPSIWKPDAFMLRQIHGFPKLIVNETEAICTDTIHRVRMLNNADPHAVSAAFLNSLTFAFSEVTGRGYGGGVQTFEPSEAEHLLLPLVGAEKLDFAVIDSLMRAGEVERVLDITDKVLLVDGLGLSIKEVSMLRGIWEKLKNRRIRRRG